VPVEIADHDIGMDGTARCGVIDDLTGKLRTTAGLGR
jgi:hypothetical protein